MRHAIRARNDLPHMETLPRRRFTGYGRELQEELCRGTALLPGPVARDASLRFRLGHDRGMAGHSSDNRIVHRCGKQVGMSRRNRCRAVRALLSRRLKLGIVTGELIALPRAHHAVVLPVPAAAGRQTRVPAPAIS